MTKRRARPSLEDLLARPAMNGGWDKLARQQDEQCARLESVETRLAALERPLKWIARGVGAVLLGVIVTLAKDWIAHIHFVVQ